VAGILFSTITDTLFEDYSINKIEGTFDIEPAQQSVQVNILKSIISVNPRPNREEMASDC
jgi:hypothetical protein